MEGESQGGGGNESGGQFVQGFCTGFCFSSERNEKPLWESLS